MRAAGHAAPRNRTPPHRIRDAARHARLPVATLPEEPRAFALAEGGDMSSIVYAGRTASATEWPAPKSAPREARSGGATRAILTGAAIWLGALAMLAWIADREALAIFVGW